jgi:hypothetical protein
MFFFLFFCWREVKYRTHTANRGEISTMSYLYIIIRHVILAPFSWQADDLRKKTRNSLVLLASMSVRLVDN